MRVFVSTCPGGTLQGDGDVGRPLQVLGPAAVLGSGTKADRTSGESVGGASEGGGACGTKDDGPDYKV